MMDVITTFTKYMYNHFLFEMISLSLKTEFGSSCPHVLKRFKLKKLERILPANTD